MSKKNLRRLKFFSRSLFIIYLIITLYLMLFSEGMGRTTVSEEYRFNLVLFKEIIRFIKYSDSLGFWAVMINVLGNIICFIPFGFFLPIYYIKLRSLLLVVILAFCFSLIIEVIQLLLKVGCFDVDDLLLNTIGGLLGYLIFIIYQKSIIRRMR